MVARLATSWSVDLTIQENAPLLLIYGHPRDVVEASTILSVEVTAARMAPRDLLSGRLLRVIGSRITMSNNEWSHLKSSFSFLGGIEISSSSIHKFPSSKLLTLYQQSYY